MSNRPSLFARPCLDLPKSQVLKTDGTVNKPGTLFSGCGVNRNCFRCNKWISQAGGGKNKRTGMWNCFGCLSRGASQ